MKRLITLIFALVFLHIAVFAQSDSTFLKNEIGMDIIPLIEQVFNFNTSEFYTPYTPTYHFGYKRHFGKISLRLGAGGAISSSTRNDEMNDEEFDYQYTNFNYRIGVESGLYETKRWRFYYGVDFKHFLDRNYQELSYQNGGWYIGSDRKTERISIAPLLGFEFKLKDNISFQTEGSFSFYKQKTSIESIARPAMDNPISDPYLRDESSSSSGLSFSVPRFLYLTFRF